jgi:Na+/melibiose symporter-like transporter
MVLLFVLSIIMRKIGKKKSFLIGNLCLIPTVIIVLIKESPMYLLFIAAIMGANTVACGYVMPWFVVFSIC